MTAPTYTHARWRVRPGSEAAFIAAWEHLAEQFSTLAAPPRWGSLLRSTDDPLLFYSFGPWDRRADIDAMRSEPTVQQAFAALRSFCEEVTPGTYELVRHVVVRHDETGA